MIKLAEHAQDFPGTRHARHQVAQFDIEALELLRRAFSHLLRRRAAHQSHDRLHDRIIERVRAEPLGLFAAFDPLD